MKQREQECRNDSPISSRFAAEAEYAESVFRDSIGDSSASIAALERALEFKPDYAPAILSMGSVEYQRGRRADGMRLLSSLVAMPEDTEDRCEIIDEAGDFLIQSGDYARGLELFRPAALRFPGVARFHQGIGCCAGHENLLDEALAASETAVQLDPANAEYVADLGWTLFLAKRQPEARTVLARALALDPHNTVAQKNLRACDEALK